MHPLFAAYGAELQIPIHQFSSSRYSLFDLQACISFNFEENMTVRYNLTLCRCLILGNSTRNIAYGNERFAAPSMERRRKLGTWNRSRIRQVSIKFRITARQAGRDTSPPANGRPAAQDSSV